MRPCPPTATLVERARAGNRQAIGRLVSEIERDPAAADAIDELIAPHTGRAHVVGVTGAPGAGKSTLTGALAAYLAAGGRRTAVLAIDPSSPLTGGAILGDRVRMDDTLATARDLVFVRSMATRGRRGGLARATPCAVRLLDACGYETVVVETTGVGQVETDIVVESDTTMVVTNPGWGDAIQANKAGLLELADVFVVNKADRPNVEQTVRDLAHMLDLGRPPEGAWRPPIVATVATAGTGVDALAGALDAHRAHLTRSGEQASRRRARFIAEVRARARDELDDALDRAIAGVTPSSATPASVAREIAAGITGRVR